ncbi:FecR family protein [Sphingobacterium daejeonense]|uniref:FecR family protein n=1 Tax=Sphingobacterium daejeonense TaxID=371142 RepID=UPI003D31F3EB
MNKEILEKFLSNQCAYNECESVASFLKENDDELDNIEIFENLSEDELIHFSEYEKDLIYETLIPQKRKIIHIKQLIIAASLLIFGIFSFYKLGFDDIHSDSPTWVNIINTEAKSKWFLLPDSSRIKLETNAKLAYRSDFASDREIFQKEGEVTYFVFPNTQSPFRVINQGIQTRAVGTVFTIGQYDKEQLLVKLLEGKIVLEDSEKSHSKQVFLTEPSTLIINTDDFSYKLLQEKKIAYQKAWEIERKSITTNYPLSSIAWSNQVVDFNGVSNADLFSIMERLFSVTIEIRNPEIVNGNFTGQLFQDDKIEDLLTIFCQINGCEFAIEDNIIRIK